MQKYTDINNDSGVDRFVIDDTSLTVWFKGANQPYTYSYTTAGQHHTEQMKKLALSGNGLNAYIRRNTKFKYDR